MELFGASDNIYCIPSTERNSLGVSVSSTVLHGTMRMLSTKLGCQQANLPRLPRCKVSCKDLEDSGGKIKVYEIDAFASENGHFLY